MDYHWSIIRDLQGETLTTVRGAQFMVAEVTSDTITVIPLSSGKKRPIKRAEIEGAIELLRQGVDLSPSVVRQRGVSEYHPAYVAAIVKAVAERS